MLFSNWKCSARSRKTEVSEPVVTYVRCDVTSDAAGASR